MAWGAQQSNDSLRNARLDRDLTQEAAAEMLTQLRWSEDEDAPPITGGMFSRWESGVLPRPPQRKLLAAFFGMSEEELGLRPHMSPAPASRQLGRYDEDGGTTTERRTFLVGAAGTFATLAGATLPDPLLTALDRLHHLADSSLGTAVDGFEAVVVDLAMAYSREPVARLYVRLDELYNTVRRISDSNPPVTYRRRLRSLAGWSTAMQANVLFDIGDMAAARANATVAMEYARQSRDTRLMAFVRDRQTMFAAGADDLAVALAIAQDGLNAGPDCCAITVRLRFAEAHLLARLGRRPEALEALHKLQAEYEALPGVEIGEGHFHLSTAFMDAGTGRVLTALGDAYEAEPYLRRNAEHFTKTMGHPSRLADLQLDLAMAVLLQGRADEASALAAAALSTDRMVSMLVRKAGRIDALLNEGYPQLADVRHFRERYLALTAAAPPSAS